MFDVLLLSVWTSDETLLLVFHILLLCVWKSDEILVYTVGYYRCIVFVSLCKGNRRSNFDLLSSHLSKYEDFIPLAKKNRNNVLALDRMNNYLYRA